MKVTAILGSPNKNGVTSSLAKEFVEEAKKTGSDTTVYMLNDMNYQGCQGCHICKSKKDYCILKDDLTRVFEDLHSSDVVVFATPVYFWDVTGQFKNFFDRSWSLVKPDYKTNPDPVRLKKGKKALFITSQGDVEEKHKEVSKRYTGFLTMYGFETQAIRAFSMGNENGDNLDSYLAQVKEIAGNILN